tara:strand:- start:45 stop:467 length:423 start_codon:yes stop_codon:yes gene_type:complete
MAHFAKINALNEVVNVVVLDDKDTQDESGNEVESVGVKYLTDSFGGTWLRTSYNTAGGIHSLGGTPFRKNYAGVGGSYDETRDAFIPIKEEPSWVLDEDTCQWKAPVAYPDESKQYDWNEDTQAWVEWENPGLDTAEEPE